MFWGEEDFKGFTIYCHASHIGHVNTIFYALLNQTPKKLATIGSVPLEEITEVVEI